MMPLQILDGFKHHHIIHLRCCLNNFQVVVERETDMIKLQVFIVSHNHKYKPEFFLPINHFFSSF